MKDAVDIVYKRELDGVENREAVRKKRLKNSPTRFASPLRGLTAASWDAIIQPRETLKKLIQAQARLETKRDNSPHQAWEHTAVMLCFGEYPAL
jgi:acetyl-CoA carboxylase carboxyltransferase component